MVAAQRANGDGQQTRRWLQRRGGVEEVEGGRKAGSDGDGVRSVCLTVYRPSANTKPKSHSTASGVYQTFPFSVHPPTDPGLAHCTTRLGIFGFGSDSQARYRGMLPTAWTTRVERVRSINGPLARSDTAQRPINVASANSDHHSPPSPCPMFLVLKDPLATRKCTLWF